MGHLFLEETTLQPSAEWALDFSGWLFVRVESGEGCWIDKTSPYLLDRGDLVVAPPGGLRSVRASRVAATTIQYFHFCPELLGGFLSIAERLRAQRGVEGFLSKAKLFPASDPVAREFSDACDQERDRASVGLRCRLLRLAVNVLVQPEPPLATGETVFLPASKRVQLFLRHLSEAELTDFTAEELAARCGCSVRHFYKLFRTFFGISLRAKRTELRLLKARQLLAETGMRVIDVAARTGFREQGLFSTAFKKRFGLTPTEWRRNGAAAVSKNGSDSR